MRTKLSYQKKLSWLKKNNVVLKKEKMRESTVDRLYSYYHKNPLNTPRDFAMGMGKRAVKNIEKGRDLQTPKGKISAQKYIQKYDEKTRKEILSQLSPNVHHVLFNQYFSGMKKIRDSFIYYINPPKGLDINNINKFSVMEHLRKNVINDIMRNIKLMWKKRLILYKDNYIGAVIIYEVSNAPNAGDPRGVAFMPYEKFEKYLHGMIWELVITDILRHYPEADISLKKIQVFISTERDKAMTEIGKLRRHG